MLYYLKQEVIGEHADSVLKGADIRYLIQLSSQAHSKHMFTFKFTLKHSQIYATFFRDLDIWMPEMEQQEVPAGWWDAEADRSLLAGVFKHGNSLLVFELEVQLFVVFFLQIWNILVSCFVLFCCDNLDSIFITRI